MRIYRLETDDGERAIGRLVTQQQMINVYARLGLDCDVVLSVDEVIAAVMNQRNSLSLINGCQLRRSLIMGQPRLELVGVESSGLVAFKAMGCFTEMIQWKTRLFVPLNAPNVLEAVLAKYPVGNRSKSDMMRGAAA